MKKKVLVALAISSLLTSSAFAINEKITYNPITRVYTLDVSGANYGRLNDLNVALTPRMAAGDVFTFNSGSLQNFFYDLVSGHPNTVNDFITTYNTANAGTAHSLQVAELYAIGDLIEDLISDKNAEVAAFVAGLEQLDYATAANVIGNAVEKLRLESQAKQAGFQTGARFKALVDKDAQIKDLSTKLEVLEFRIKMGEQNLQSELSKLKSQVYSNSKINAVRNSPDTQEELKIIVKAIETDRGSSNKLLKAAANGLLKDLKNDQEVYLADASKVAVSELPQVQKPDTHTTEAMLNSSLTTNAVLSERVGGFSGPNGIASGDMFQTYGAWVKGIYSKGEQKAFSADPGYEFNQSGVTIGADTGDEAVVGAAYSFFKNQVKSKTNASTKDDIDTHVGSIYGMTNIAPQVFVSAQASYGFSKIEKRRATGDAKNNIAKASPEGRTVSGKAEVGYAHPITEVISVTPAVGLSHSHVKVYSYKEKGSGLNRSVGERKSQRTSGLAGVSLKYLVEADAMKVMPEVHANVDYAFSNKNSSTSITVIDGLAPLVTPSEKISKAYYNIGASVKVAASEMVDVSAGYDLGLSKKFMSHTGALKLRVNF